MRRLVSGVAAIGLVFAGVGATGPTAWAAKCPSDKVGGKAIGWIEFDDVRVPLKKVNYPAGGALDPPASAKVAGVSARHRDLLSKQGTTVVAWHVRYGKGCNGSLNPILKEKVGSTFDVVTASGDRQTYRIVERDKVERGDLQPEWFRTNGSPQMTLFTCSDLDRGKYRKTSVLVADPVPSSSDGLA